MFKSLTPPAVFWWLMIIGDAAWEECYRKFLDVPIGPLPDAQDVPY